MSLTKKELVEKLAARHALSKTHVGQFLDSLALITHTALQAGQPVILPGLGKLSVVARGARVGRNPVTGESIHIPAQRVVKFTAATSLKNAANAGATKNPAPRGKS